MKKTDLAMIVLIAAVSVLAAFFITKAVLGEQATDEKKVQTIEKIDTTVTQPDPEIFNERAINPAVEVQITPGNQ